MFYIKLKNQKAFKKMTFTHLMNCFALTYGPIYSIYSGAKL